MKPLLQKARIILSRALAILGACVVLYLLFRAIAVLWSGEHAVAMKVITWTVSGFFYVIVRTIHLLVVPIAVYLVLEAMIRSSLLRVGAGIGCAYLLWLVSGDLELSLSSATGMLLTFFQIYFLLVLVLPAELITIVGGVVCVIGSAIIYVMPDLPTSLDDVAGICTLISVVFIYVNSIALFIKQRIGPQVHKLAKGERIDLRSIFRRDKRSNDI